MLQPDYLLHIADRAVDISAELENDIIRDIIRRLNNTDFVMTQSAKWQIHKAQQAGALYDDIIRQVAAGTKKTEYEVKTLFEDAAVETLAYDERLFKRAGMVPPTLKSSKTLLDIVNNGYKATCNELRNFTRTTASAGQTAFINAADKAYIQVMSGAFDYNTAIYNAVKDLAQQGVKVRYDSGHTDRIDVATRRAVMTGINKTCGDLEVERNNEMGVYIYEVTAHAGARESHAVWQGGWYDIRGDGYSEYAGLAESTGWGTGAGLEGWNCRHSKHGVIPGISKPAYTKADIERLNSKTVEYDGDSIPRYEAQQKQRGMERDIRDTKRNLAAMDALGDNPQAKAEFNRLSVKLKKQESKLSNFLEQTGLKEQRSLVRVPGFGKSQAQKAVHANKTELSKRKKDGIIKSSNGKAAINKRATTRLEKYAKTKWGVKSVDLSGLDAKAIIKTFRQMDRVFTDFPALQGQVVDIIKSDSAIMSCQPRNRFDGVNIKFNKTLFNDAQKIDKIYDDNLKLYGSPIGTKYYHTGAHELGHATTAAIIKKHYGVTSAMSHDWNNDDTARYIVSKAVKGIKMSDADIRRGVKAYAHILRVDVSKCTDDMLLQIYKSFNNMDKRQVKLCSISNYASVSPAETIGEAFSDWYANGKNANPISKKIISIVKELLQ